MQPDPEQWEALGCTWALVDRPFTSTVQPPSTHSGRAATPQTACPPPTPTARAVLTRDPPPAHPAPLHLSGGAAAPSRPRALALSLAPPHLSGSTAAPAPPSLILHRRSPPPFSTTAAPLPLPPAHSLRSLSPLAELGWCHSHFPPPRSACAGGRGPHLLGECRRLPGLRSADAPATPVIPGCCVRRAGALARSFPLSCRPLC